MNSRITKRERGLIKGALRRVFSRSELRKEILDKSVIVGYADITRPKVKTWCRCAVCEKPEAKSYMAADHIIPVVPVDSSLEELSLDELANRIWCEPKNLQIICPQCHDEKTFRERKERTKHKKEKREKNGKPSKTTPVPTKKRRTRANGRSND